MWTQPRTTFHGRYFHAEEAILEPKPIQKPHPPVMIAGGGEQLTLRAVARFADAETPREFCADWVGVAGEEAEHFALLADRLAVLGANYGDLPAHDGLWEAAALTAGDLLARLAIVPLVLEARGLDVTPEMILRLERAGDSASAAILRRIYEDEIGHVAVGARWLERLCRERGLDPEAVFHDQVRRYFSGTLKPPFNNVARDAAGLPRQWYERLSAAPRA